MPLEKLIVYFAMVFCIVLELVQMRYNANYLAWRKERWKTETAAQIEEVRAEMEERLAQERAGAQGSAAQEGAGGRIQPVIIGNNVYVMMPVAGEDAASFKELLATSDEAGRAFDRPLEIGAEVADVEPTYEEPGER